MSDREDHKPAGFTRLWAPWRMMYIEGIDVPGTDGCIFCDKPVEDDDLKNYIVHRGKTCYVILNTFPYNNGHLMVVPYRHTANLDALGEDELLEMMSLTRRMIGAMKQTMRPDGFNVGMNLGRTAGAGIADHLHMHIVPRWNGDTNFMPVVGGAKVISEALDATRDKLRRAVDAAAGDE